ncbi:DUF1641 domain-containing protein [Terriglobus roseus]|uniref:Uncharacterized conserved protein YjgD, DUF1641 family n=1 Tax=Terriglobus roseus TaxID=392734 RepID=A0A1H4LBC3_9BACT|nr:DUF1641 domain-containing protein [Terriglobus roseus]SEB67796.1 Uncharacterized conserved protein YjgD, DUF1641 family [Terriglobus roseus]
MANPIAFTPLPYDPKDGLMRRLEAAPRAHAEALLVAYDLLQEAHDQGILDALHGMVHAKDAIVGHIAEGARVQESVDALRNMIAAAKILGSIEPETMSCIAAAMNSSGKKKTDPPLSLWGIFKRATSIEGRRGLTVAVELLAALGTRR